MDEGFADYFACDKTNDEVHGESVGVNRHLSNILTMDDYIVGGDPHYNGQIIGGACWNLRASISNVNELIFRALLMETRDFETFANCVVIVDDSSSDNNLSNGTPHLESIRSAFYGKKIYFSAGPPGAPSNVTINGSVGQHPTISWSANKEPDLKEYKVYREITPYESGFSLVATVNKTQTSYTDNHCTRCQYHGYEYPNAHYYIVAIDNSNYSSNASSTVYSWVNYSPPKRDNEKLSQVPEVLALESPYPNPFNPSTKITFGLTKAGNVSVKVYDLLGREVETLISGTLEAGYHSVNFNAGKLNSGMYIVRFQAEGRQLTRKMVLSK